MPNPLSRVRPNGATVIFGQDLFRAQPRIAHLYLLVINKWASLETRTGSQIIALLGTDAESAVEDIIENPRSQAHRDKLLECAQATIDDPHHFEIFSAIVSAMNSLAKARNRLIHWHIGLSPNLPNCLLLKEPRHHWRAQLISAKWSESLANPAFSNDQIDELSKREHALSARGTWVWTENELSSLKDEIRVVERAFFEFQWLLSGRPHRDGEGYRWLMSQPLLRSRIRG